MRRIRFGDRATIGIPMQEWAASTPPPIAVTYPGARAARCVLVATTGRSGCLPEGERDCDLVREGRSSPVVPTAVHPREAEEDTLIVVLDPVVELGVKEAVAWAGNPLTVNATDPANPYSRVMAML